MKSTYPLFSVFRAINLQVVENVDIAKNTLVTVYVLHWPSAKDVKMEINTKKKFCPNNEQKTANSLPCNTLHWEFMQSWETATKLFVKYFFTYKASKLSGE